MYSRIEEVAAKLKCNHSAELEMLVSGLKQQLEHFLKVNIDNLWQEINENIKPKINEFWEMTGRGLFDVNHLADHLEKEIEKNFDRLDELRKNYTANIEDARKRISKLEGNLKQLKIHAEPMQQQVWQENILKRLENLESDHIGQQLDPKVWKFVSDQIDELKASILNWEQEFYFLKDKLRSHEKNPHKCPVCYGRGEITLMSVEESIKNGGQQLMDCKSCEGKGIVWG